MRSLGSPICKSGGHCTVTSYKHYWSWCTSCGNVIRTQKRRYLLENIPRSLYRLFPNGIQDQVYLSLNRKPTDSDFYSYYLDPNLGQTKESVKSGWENQFARINRELKEINFHFNGRDVLDISGEPSFFVRDMSGVCARAVVTAYSDVVPHV